MNMIRVVLPNKYDLVVGDTFQLFYRGVVEAPDPFVYDVLAVCAKGKNFPRYFEFLPDEPGQYELTISVFGPDKSLLGQGRTVLDVAAAVQPSRPVNILCMGASTVAGGEWVSEAYRRLVSEDGDPKGLGLKNIAFIGTCKKGDAGYEGYGGWQWDSYLSATVGDMWVNCFHDKTLEDQHSIWQDDQGNLWQLETIDIRRLKFTRYKRHTAPRPQNGRMTHVRNAVQKNPVVFGSSYDERLSPFYDEGSQSIDFQKYCERNGFSGIDAVYVMLGLNGLMNVEGSLKEHCGNLVRQAKKLVDLIHRDFPSAFVKVMGVQLPCTRGGVGWNYGAVLPYCDDYGLVRYIMELNLAYKAWAEEPEYCGFVEYINVSGQLDADNMFPSIEKPVNVRSKKTEVIGVNALHPLPEGYMMIADAVFRNMVHLCAQVRDDEAKEKYEKKNN